MPRSDRRRGHGAAWLSLMLLGSAAVAAVLALRVLAVLTADAGRPAVAHLPVEQLVEVGALGVGTLAAAWLALSSALALGYVAVARLGRRWRAGEALLERAAPALVRRLARTAVGVGVGAGIALAPTAALAADEPAGAAEHGGAGTAVVLDLGWQPTGTSAEPTDPAPTPTTAEADQADRTDDETAAPPQVADDRLTKDGPATVQPADDRAATNLVTTVTRDLDHAEHDGPDTVVVLRGDTLWDIAAQSLADDGVATPSDAEVMREMTRWHEANRDVVGADPDVILPGQVLRAPG